MRTVILDNYDSFTFNLYQYLAELDEPPRVFRNDQISLSELRRLNPERIVISPGPGHPANPAYFGVCMDVLLKLGPFIPTLGVCLGHQGIICAFGGKVVPAARVMHGKTSVVIHDGAEMFRGIPRRFEAMRYHSLVGDPKSMPACLCVTAWTEDGTIMGVQHCEHPIYGVQFHPESIGTTFGKRLLGNFLRLEGELRVHIRA